jgi:carbonic anhydrase/acetyltransferase-like protein (isoleucine patch superfamily)
MGTSRSLSSCLEAAPQSTDQARYSVACRAKIENCILAQRCVVGEKATLTDCEVGGQFKVAAESKVKGEKLADLS